MVCVGLGAACNGVADYPDPAATGGNGSQSGSSSSSGGSSNGGSSSGGSSNGGSSNGGGSATAGNGSGGMTSGGVAFTQVVSILNQNCGLVGCHNTGGQSPNFSLNGSTLYTTLTSANTITICPGGSAAKLAVPNDTTSSQLIQILTVGCNGTRMPLGCTTNPCLSAGDMQTLTTWVTEGAPSQ